MRNLTIAALLAVPGIAAAQAPTVAISHETMGSGPIAQPGATVAVRYTGWLDASGRPGRKFDSSADHGGEPIRFRLGAGEVIAGWDQGVAGMRVGGKRRLTIPAALGYGVEGAGSDIPPNATLIFDVELVAVDQ